MSAYTKTQAAIVTLQATMTALSALIVTINNNASSPYSTADIDAEFTGIVNGYNSQLTKIYNELTKLQINLSAG